MVLQVFSLDANSSTHQLQEQLEKAASFAIKRLEDEVARLEYLLEESQEKIDILDKKLQRAEELLQSLQSAENFKNENTSVKVEEVVSKEGVTSETEDVIKSVPIEDGSPGIQNDKRKLILAMSDQGYNVTEIAKATGIGKGEIMLLLQLNKK